MERGKASSDGTTRHNMRLCLKGIWIVFFRFPVPVWIHCMASFWCIGAGSFLNLSWFYQRVGGGLKHLKNHFAVNFVSVIYLIVFFRSAGPSCDVNTTWLHVTGNGTDYPDVYRAHGSTWPQKEVTIWSFKSTWLHVTGKGTDNPEV